VAEEDVAEVEDEVVEEEDEVFEEEIGMIFGWGQGFLLRMS